MNISLDGCADHNVAIADEELHDFSTNLLATVDTILFGRLTYKLFESYWPTAPNDPRTSKSMVEFANQINAMPKMVFSKTLQEANWNNTKLFKGDAVKEVARLKQASGGSLSIGGISMIQTFMNMKMIDEYWLLVQPLLWGKGRRLFDELDGRIDLKLVETRTFHSGVVVLHYSAG
jgi:dihydrofolate reductase